MNLRFWKKKIEKMSFQETLDTIGLPVITFRQGNKKFNFLLDTGANYSVINKPVLENLAYTESAIQDVESYGVDGNKITSRLVNISFSYKNNQYEDMFQVIDMTQAFGNLKKEYGATLHGILGNSFMQKYKYVLDFADMIAYSKQ